MFELDDDFDIDEAFLDGVFSVEQDVEKSKELTEQVPPKKRKSGDHDVVPVLPISGNSSPELGCTASVLVARSSEETASLLARAKHTQHPDKALSSNRASDTNLWKFGTAVGNAEDSSNKINIHPSGFGNRNAAVHQISNKRHTQQNSSSGNFGSERSNSPRPLFNTIATKVRHRKFPGPAGLLPERAQRSSFSLAADNSCVDEVEEEEPLCSQSAVSVLEDGPWLKLQADLASEGQDLLEKYTVAWVKQKSAARQLVGQKVPFLAAVMHSLDCSSPDPCIVLRDSTGEIPGTLHRSVWEKFGGQLIVGSALVLRLVGVLSTGVAARRHYLNITGNNIVTIYSSGVTSLNVNPDSQPKSQVLSYGPVRTTSVHKLTMNDLWTTVRNWEEQSRNLRQNSSPLMTGRGSNSNSPHASLFNTISPNQNPVLLEKRHDIPVISHCPSRNSLASMRVSTSSLNNQQTCITEDHPNAPRPPVSHPATTDTILSRQDGRHRSFVPKKPSFFNQSGSQNADVALKTNSSVQSPLQFQHQHNSRKNSQEISLSLTEFDEDLEVSSVLDGIDSDSLFGEF